MSPNEELCQYLKENDFEQFMKAWRTQYERSGTCRGRIKLAITASEKEALEGFIGKTIYGQHYFECTFTTIKKAIRESRFEGADFNEVLHLYFPDEIVTNKCAKQRKEDAFSLFFENVVEKNANTRAYEWLRMIYDTKNHNYKRIFQEWKKEIEPKNKVERKEEGSCKKEIEWIIKAIDEFPIWNEMVENVAVFSSRITGDPHAFDKSTFCYYLLFQAICFYFPTSNKQYTLIEQNEIIYQSGLYYDSVSNFCSIARIRGYMADGKYHPGWKGFYKYYEAFNATMDNVEQIEAIDHAASRTVLIVENPSIFQALVKRGKDKNYKMIGFVCTNGQINTCGYRLLDKIFASGAKMYYGGDMDPEGMMIADRLKEKYGKQLVLWRYSVDDFKNAKSDRWVGERRKAILENLQDDNLKKVAEQLILDNRAGYQENIVQDYLDDLDKIAYKYKTNS